MPSRKQKIGVGFGVAVVIAAIVISTLSVTTGRPFNWKSAPEVAKIQAEAEPEALQIIKADVKFKWYIDLAIPDTFGPKHWATKTSGNELVISPSTNQQSLFFKLKRATDDELESFVGIKFADSTYTISSIDKPTEAFKGFTINVTPVLKNLPGPKVMEVQIYTEKFTNKS